MAAGDGDEYLREADIAAMLVASMSTEQLALARVIAASVVAHLAATAPFTAEDIERIKDHVHPQGVTYKNGFKAGFEAAVQLAAKMAGDEVGCWDLSKEIALLKPT